MLSLNLIWKKSTVLHSQVWTKILVANLAEDEVEVVLSEQPGGWCRQWFLFQFTNSWICWDDIKTVIGPKLSSLWFLLMLVYSFSQKVGLGPQTWIFSWSSFTDKKREDWGGRIRRELKRLILIKPDLKPKPEELCFEPVKSTISLVSTFLVSVNINLPSLWFLSSCCHCSFILR